MGSPSKSLDPTLNTQAVRRHNLAVVLTHVARRGALSRAHIARDTGLSKTTVSSVVAELSDARLLREVDGTPTGRAGRPSRAYAIDTRHLAAIALEVDVDGLSVAVVDLRGRLITHSAVARDNRGRPAAELADALARLTRRALVQTVGRGLEPVAIVVAIPGLVDFARGIVLLAPNLAMRHVPFAALLAEHLDAPSLPIIVDNEANLAALGELAVGDGTARPDFVYVSAGHGVGAGVIIGGRLYRGGGGFSGEFGHMTIRYDGTRCVCGSRGCVEVYTSLATLLRLAGIKRRNGSAEAPVDVLRPRRPASDARTLEAIGTVGRALGAGVASLANLASPASIVLGGYVPDLAEWLLAPVQREVLQRALVPCEIVLARVERDVRSRGAGHLTLERVLEDPAALRPLAR